MPTIRPFEIGLIVAFIIAALVGLFVLSTHKSEENKAQALYGTSFSIWGTADAEAVNGFIHNLAETNDALKVVQYRQVDPRTFESELTNAIAEGKSPELILIPHTFLASLRTKLQPLSFETFPERTFRDTYIDGAAIFMLSDGVYGFPVAVNPLVMYWNRDIFSSSGLAQPPKTWEELVGTVAPLITRVDDRRTISQSAMSFGEYANVLHAKEILSLLFLQAGSTIVDEQNKAYAVTIGRNTTGGLPPGESVLPFYTQFADPTKQLYSWNRSLPTDRTAFLQGTLAMYFGMGNERTRLDEENPNLNFDMAEVPQGSGATIRRGYGDFYAFAIPRGSKNPAGSYAIATLFSNAQNAQVLAKGLFMAPVYRAQMNAAAGDLYAGILNQAALIARGWLDPDPIGSASVFRQMVEEVMISSGRIQQIVNDTVHRLEALF